MIDPLLVLGIDPGAERLGWGMTLYDHNGEFQYIDSGLNPFPRYTAKGGKKEEFQVYRRRLIEHWPFEFDSALKYLEQKASEHRAAPKVVFETVPAIGFGASGGSVQAQLAAAVATICQAMCEVQFVPWEQVSASTVKLKLTGWGNATKVQVRDAVLKQYPGLEPRKKELTSSADESDGIGISLIGAGFKVPKAKVSNPRKKAKSND